MVPRRSPGTPRLSSRMIGVFQVPSFSMLLCFNAVSKVERYAPDYPGLRGRDLTPKAVIERPFEFTPDE